MSVNFPKISIFIIAVILLFSVKTVSSQNTSAQRWVDSVFNTLTDEQRIAQLLIIRGYSNRDAAYNKELVRLVKELKLGGVCFFQGGPVRQAIITNRIQQSVDVPAFIAIDGEWGLGMRLDSVLPFPKQMTLGAVKSDQYIYDMGREVALQMKRIGVHINFAPVADINNNQHNPVINARSFGEDRQRVAEKSYFYMKGMQDGGLIAVAKHFPGHGDTDIDSHYSLPIIDKPRQVIDSVELYPFKYLISRGLKGVMVSHLRVPTLDTASNSIATLSEPILKDLLRKQMGFTGMIITDGMDMKGLVDFSDIGRVEADALKAGNDILLLPVDAINAINNICNAISEGYITQELIDEKCKRVLTWKYESGLYRRQMIDIKGITDDINTPESRLTVQYSNARAITLLRNPNKTIPLKNLDTTTIACLVIGDTAYTAFQNMLSNYYPVRFFNLPKDATKAQFDSIAFFINPYDLIITAFSRTSDMPQKRYNITKRAAAFVDSLALKKRTILTLFASPYSLAFFNNANNLEGLIVAYQDNKIMQELTAQAIFGGRSIDGVLPVTIANKFTAGEGLVSDEVIRIAFGLPEEVGVSSLDLAVVDSIVYSGIDNKAYPGAQVVVIKSGKVIMNKAYGFHSYNSFIPVKTTDLYDLASLTKVIATTMMAMKLTDEKIINPDRKLSHYNTKLKKSNKKDFTIREIMAHEARMQSFIPFHAAYTFDTTKPFSEFLARRYSIDYPNRVADALYSRADVPDLIIDSIIKSGLLVTKGYRYSDLGFILLAKTFEELVDQPLSYYLNANFYRKMGLTTLGFNPLDRFNISRIAPTEMDRKFRGQLIHGDVHDQTAALMGGVAGHAGLFSNALDVGILMQMMLNKGEYGGERFIDPSTIEEFTEVQYKNHNNRRGAGFDKPPLNKDDASPTCRSASPSSYGHSGFTGTYVWVDPEYDLVYVFLSNRIHPDTENTKLAKYNIRTNVQEAIYQAINKGYRPQFVDIADN